jgi:hypothetical protein
MQSRATAYGLTSAELFHDGPSGEELRSVQPLSQHRAEDRMSHRHVYVRHHSKAGKVPQRERHRHSAHVRVVRRRRDWVNGRVREYIVHFATCGERRRKRHSKVQCLRIQRTTRSSKSDDIARATVTQGE